MVRVTVMVTVMVTVTVMVKIGHKMKRNPIDSFIRLRFEKYIRFIVDTDPSFMEFKRLVIKDLKEYFGYGIIPDDKFTAHWYDLIQRYGKINQLNRKPNGG